MPDIKIRPQLDRPKVRQKNNAPKEAADILKKSYQERQQQRQPGQKGAVRYATDEVEITGKRGVVIAADGIRRTAKRNNAKKPEGGSAGYDVDTSNGYPPENAHSESAPDFRPVEHGKRQFVQERHQDAALPRNSRCTMLQSEAVPVREQHTATPFSRNQEHSPPTPQERGRQRVQRAKGQQKIIRDHAEKETAGRPFWRPVKNRVDFSPLPKGHTAGVKQKTDPMKRALPHFSTGKSAEKNSRKTLQRKAQKKMLAQATQKMATGVKASGQMIAQAAAAVGRAAASAVTSIVALGGGAALLVVLLLVIVIGAIAASPFGLLFADSNATTNTVPVATAIAQVQDRLNTQLEGIQSADTYDNIALQGSLPDWIEVLAVFAVKVVGSDADAADVVTMDADRISRLKTVFADMCAVSHEVNTTNHLDSDPDDDVDDSRTEKDLTISIMAKTAAEMAEIYGFTTEQLKALEELLAQPEVLTEIATNLDSISVETSDILSALPDDLSAERKAVVNTACSLVGKVNYFWGGKSSAIGWDSRWGQLQKVTAAGSSTTDTYRPFGMDCSGFVDWVFNNAHGYVIGHGGGAASQHSYCTDISGDDAVPGDLVFYPNDTHVGIVAGYDEDGGLLVVHCSSERNNVVITKSDGFTSVARADC